MKIKILGHTVKCLTSATRGRWGYRHSRTGRDFPNRREIENYIASLVFPYPFVGGPPVKASSVNNPQRRAA